MNAILNLILSYKGILALTMLILLASALVYCRIVTGVGIASVFAAAPSFSKDNSGESDWAGGLKKLLSKASPSSFSNPVYEEIEMNGGTGLGTVSEILARQTEKKILDGEPVDTGFIQEPPFTPVFPPEMPEQKTTPNPVNISNPLQGETGDLFDGFSLGDTYEA